MSDRDRERIRGIGRWRRAQAERRRDDTSDLRLVGGASTGDRPLHERGRVLRDVQPALLRDQERDASNVRQLDRRGGVLRRGVAPKMTYPLVRDLAAETGGLTLDQAASGLVTLTVTAPAGITIPAGFPVSVPLTRGRASATVRFPAAGYYRIRADGPDGSIGWTTIVIR